eukprot:jgi/Picsp_1/1087/NSC_04570-R1_electron transfer flavoprotein subunit mitochondrial precursor
MRVWNILRPIGALLCIHERETGLTLTKLSRQSWRDVSRNMSTLVVCGERGVDEDTLGIIRAATRLKSGPLHALLAGSNVEPYAQDLQQVPGVERVLIVKDAAFDHGLAEPWSALIAGLQQQYKFSYIVGPSNSFGTNLIPRAAAVCMKELQVQIEPISNVVEIIDPVTFKRPIYAGNAVETVRYKGSGLKLLTCRASSFPGEKGSHVPTSGESQASSEIEYVSDALIERIKTKFPRSFNNTMSKWLEDIWETSTDMPKLSHAKIVLAGGRGLKNREGFKRLEGLARKVGAAVGATRAAVDAGYASNDLQIGQSGKIVAPDLYIAFGISGAIQHLAGIKDSKTIVAINSDPEAPIFKVPYDIYD